MSRIKESLQLNVDKITYWTDSTIVIHWLQTPPQNLKTFASNRVNEIQTKTKINSWRHVRTHDNPADLVSRGSLPDELLKSSLWTQGPSWLCQDKSTWPQSIITTSLEELPEIRKAQCFQTTPIYNDLFNKYSSIYKLQTIVSYCMRLKRDNFHKNDITVSELRTALHTIIRKIQQDTFAKELSDLTNKKLLHKQSRLLPLNPFVDKTGLLRGGGRLKNSLMPFNHQHPIILPQSHHVTTLLIKAEHHTHLHAGVQATLYALRRRFWLLNERNEVRKVIRNCITCCKLQPPSLDYLMGDLPADRVTQSRPFSRVGIDYCGPFFIKEKRHRNQNKIKVYVAIFVCLSIKAVHLEVVSDLTTDAFLAALKRFVGRRGLCSDIYSDNATNFVGARNELKELFILLDSKEHQQKVHNFAVAHNIEWHFIPARSPHFGGLWEAAVKSFKHHLRRIIGNTLLTYEDLNTFVIEVEAILNSHPLTSIFSDLNDILVLTPGHFLIGDSLMSLPDLNISSVPVNRLSHWQHIQQMRQHFWTRWSREYLNELTVRHKWTKSLPNIQLGTVVLLKEDNLLPLQWIMGRITKLYPGNDEIVRVVQVKTAKGIYDRSLQKLAPLPIQPTDEPPPASVNGTDTTRIDTKIIN